MQLPNITDSLVAQQVWSQAKTRVIVPTHLSCASLSGTITYGVPFFCETAKEMLLLIGFDNPATGAITAPLVTMQLADAYPVISSGGTPQFVTDPNINAIAVTNVTGTAAQTTTVVRVTNFGSMCRIGFSSTGTPTLSGNIYVTVVMKD